MRVIKVPDPFLQADGYPFRVPTRDKSGQFVPMKRDGQEVRDADGNVLVETHDGTFAEVLRTFINEVFRLARQERLQAQAERREAPKELTIEDSAHAVDIHRAINVIADGKLELERAPHEWLLRMIDDWGVKVLGASAAVLKEPIARAEEVEPTRAEKRRAERAQS